jgi:hypothetical protein
MKRIVEWVRTILSRPEEPVVDDQPSKPVSEADLVTPDIYAEVKTTAEILNLSSPDSDKKTGFNPYDTARLHKK